MCASLLALSSAGTGTAAALPTQLDKHTAKQTPKTVVAVKKQEQEKIYLPDQKVRVIVEMKEESAIEFAQKQGKRYKDLDKNTKNKLHAEKKAGQKKVKDKAKSKNVNFKELESFTTVVNGFSVETEYKNITALASIEEVANVHIANEYQRPLEKPEMIYSKELVQAQEAWRDYGYKGEGMVVGVIDTGIDPSHRDMVLSEGVEGEISSAEVAGVKSANGLMGKFYSEKVPYGYNYMDDNEEILDLGPDASMHGMHVAGTVGANGDEENKGIKGVAPEAQLLALKVFGNDPNMPSTWGDIYVKAIDEAIILGADVLNMSLGSTAGFVRPEDPEQAAVQRAVDNGILMSISAGNSAHFGNGFANPLASNPDIGVSGSPGVSFNSLQVASVENNFMDLDGASYTTSGGVTGVAPFLSASSIHPNDIEQKTFDVVYAGLGKPEELASVDVKGKIALIKRGELAFVDKAKNAQAAGAAAVIIYNNADGYVSMASDPSITIPQLFMLKSDGDKLQAQLVAGNRVSISFNGEKAKSANPEAGKMSAFSSWGMTPNLDFKPEVTAPGGQIYSTLNDDQYGMMSGTSMAAPHVAGGSALVLQRVEKDFKNVNGLEKVNLVKNLLMNTAAPLIDKGTVNNAFKWNLPYSPRKQGAGVMQLHSALQTPVVVTAANTNEGKVALKEVGNQFSFTLKAQNYSSTDAQYDVAANIQTDFAIEGQLGYSANVLETQKILDAIVKINGEDSKVITVPANGSVTFEVTVDVSQAKVVEPSITGSWTTPVDINKVFPNGYFVEGYVTLKDSSDLNAELHVPYAGFKGEWDKAPVLDGTIYDESSFYGMAGAVSKSADTYNYLGYNPVDDSFNGQYIAISPNGDGVQDELIPVLSFLRNAKQVEFNVLDQDSKAVRKLRTEFELRKNYYDGGRSANYSLDPARQWDGKINNLVAKDGQYYFETKAAVDYEGAEFQSYKIPVLVDTVKPTVTAKGDATGRTLTIQAADTTGGAGVSYLDILVDGNSILTAPLAADTTEFVLPETVKAGARVEVVAIDFAGNTATATVTAGSGEVPVEDKTVPSVFVNDPAALSTYNTNTVPVNGYIVEPSGLKEFTIAGKPVALTYNEEKGQYEFSTTLTLADGVHSFEVKAVDNADNAIAFKRSVIVDSTVPVLSITGLPKKNTVGATDPNPKVDVKVTDNFDEIRLYLNGNEIFYQPFKEPYAMRAFSKVIEDVELPLVTGKNDFTFEVTDLAGNKTTKTITITKQAPKGKGK